MHSRFLIRELVQSRKQALIFVLCVALSLTTLVALNGFKRDVNHSILGDAKSLHGGDIILHSHYDFAPELTKVLKGLESEKRVQSVKTYEFYSVIRTPGGQETLLADIKIVGKMYPQYGEVTLQSGRLFSDVLGQGKIVVERTVLERLNLEIGDFLHVGNGRLQIADILLHEPDRPVNIFSFGPRVFVSESDTDQLDLIKKGSRVEYEILVKINDDKELNELETQLKNAALPPQERVNTYRNADSGVKRFFDNLLFFLSLISIFTLLLAGLGIQSSLGAFFRQREKTLAIIKALGADNRFLYQHYLVLVVGLGGIGSILGICSGMLLERYFPILFEGLIPSHTLSNSVLLDVFQGLLLGVVVILFFSFLPLYRLRNIKPNIIFRKESRNREMGIRYYLILFFGFLFLASLVVGQLEDTTIGLSFIFGILALVGCISFLAQVTLLIATGIPLSSLRLKQGVKSLTRPGNATRSIVVTLASALSVLFSIYLVESNLQATYVEAYPDDAPNLYCLDIQPDQREAFLQVVGQKEQLFPVVRARVVSINGKPINRQAELKKKRDSFAREFNLTYRETLLDDEILLAGKGLFPIAAVGKTSEIPVSILDTVSGMGDIELNDLLQFNIQGVLLEARVSSIRTRTKSKLYPFFYFVFPEKFLRHAPKTYFAALKMDSESRALFQKKIGAKFPNISFIDVTETAKELGGLLHNISTIITFFAIFSILAGGLILISSVLSTRYARIREAVYYKILGGSSSFVYSVYIYENMLLGLFSALFAVLIAQVGSWALCHYLFEISYKANLLASLSLVLLTIFLVVMVGMVSSLQIVRQKPLVFLREQIHE